MAALERQHREEEAHGAAARVTHQQGGGLGIHPQVGQQCADEDDGGGAVVPQFLAVSQQEGADALVYCLSVMKEKALTRAAKAKIWATII